MRYLVTWQFMGQRGQSFSSLVDAVTFARTIIDGLKPIHVEIEAIPF